MNVVIDGAAIDRHHELARKYLLSTAICRAVELCSNVVVAYSRTEVSEEDMRSTVAAACRGADEFLRSLAGDPELQLLSTLGFTWVLTEVYSLVASPKPRLSSLCLNVKLVGSRGVKKAMWRQAIDKAFNEYLSRCIPRRAVEENPDFRDTLAGDFENWLKEPIKQLCRQAIEEEVIVLTHDKGLEEYGGVIATCFTQSIGCRAEVKVIREACDYSVVQLLIRILSQVRQG